MLKTYRKGLISITSLVFVVSILVTGFLSSNTILASHISFAFDEPNTYAVSESTMPDFISNNISDNQSLLMQSFVNQSKALCETMVKIGDGNLTVADCNNLSKERNDTKTGSTAEVRNTFGSTLFKLLEKISKGGGLGPICHKEPCPKASTGK